MVHQMRQDRGLITRAGANLQHARIGRELKQLRHARHHVRLRNRLALPNRQRHVFPRFVFKRLVYKFLTRNLSKRFKHVLVADPLRAELFQKSLYTFVYHCAFTPARSSQPDTTSCALYAVKSTCRGVTET